MKYLEKYLFSTCECVFEFSSCSKATFLMGCVTTLWFQRNLVSSSPSNTGMAKDYFELGFCTFSKAVFGAASLLNIKFKY